MRTRRLLLIVAAGILGALSMPAQALAHNELTGSDPADGATMKDAPERMKLTFRANLDPLNSRFTVTVPDGQSTPVDDPKIDGGKASFPIPAGPAGEYQVGYEVLSSDGDWVDGTVTFTVAEAPAPAPASNASPDPAGYATDTATAAATAVATAEESGGGGWWGWLFAAAGLAVVGGYGGYRLARRRAAT